LFAVYALLTYGAQVLTAALNALRRTRDVYRATGWSLVVALTAGWILVALLGATGGALGLIVAAAAGTVALARSYDAARPGVADPTATGAEKRG
jgi:O-antigen/teichoic acid export membrane protein